MKAHQETFKILKTLFVSSHSIFYRKGEIIIRPDDTPQGVYFLVKGFVKFYCVSREGGELIFLIFKRGDFFPARFAITNEPITYYYETMTPVEVKRVPTESFRLFLKQHPDVLYGITASMMNRLRIVFERMQHLAYGSAYEKVASILYMFSQEYGKKERGGVSITVPLTHKDIAFLIGLTRETVSLEMGILSEKKLISHVGKLVVVKNPQKLRQESLLKFF